MSGEDHNHAVAHAATGLGKVRQGEETREKKGRGRRVVCCGGCSPRKEKGEERVKEESGRKGKGSKVEKQGASHLCPRVLQPCHHAMLLREEWRGWLSCASMSMSMRGNVMCGISCHHHHDELFVCQCVLQPVIPVCMCVCLCAEGTPVQAAGRRAHTPKKEERRESVCERRKRETAGQMNQPSEVKQRACVCV